MLILCRTGRGTPGFLSTQLPRQRRLRQFRMITISAMLFFGFTALLWIDLVKSRHTLTSFPTSGIDPSCILIPCRFSRSMTSPIPFVPARTGARSADLPSMRTATLSATVDAAAAQGIAEKYAFVVPGADGPCIVGRVHMWAIPDKCRDELPQCACCVLLHGWTSTVRCDNWVKSPSFDL